MSDIVIKVENLSKQYRLGQIGTGTISNDLNRWWHKIRGNEDPYLKIGEENDRSKKGSSEYVWALRNISFEVKHGEVLGIIGRNGAGKSTLLKILSRTTVPTTGNIKIKGRVASLLEVGTGFHPDLSGRDNIFLNGAILGMSKTEIKRKFDEIVDFSGVERYIDTPVKRYSSGMYVRLAFGVAAHLEPEILIVDEVLAVGDAEFQKKALGKMKDVSNKDGRTVLFVSHNMPAIRTLCTEAMIVKNGTMSYFGMVDESITKYFSSDSNVSIDLKDRTDRSGNGMFCFSKIQFRNSKNEIISETDCGTEVFIDLFYDLKDDVDFRKLLLSLAFTDNYQNYFAFFPSDEMGGGLKQNVERKITLHIPALMLRSGEYKIWLFASYAGSGIVCDTIENAATFKVISIDFWNAGKPVRDFNSALINGKYIS